MVDRGVVEIKSMIKKQSLDVAFWDCKSKRIVLYRKREKIDLADLWGLGECSVGNVI